MTPMHDINLIERVETIQPGQLPEGTYAGVQGGYEVKVVIDGATYKMRTVYGVRGFDIPVFVTIKDGQAKFAYELPKHPK